MSKSIISNAKRCYLCGSEQNLERHHCIFGTSARRKAESDGLWVYLCHRDHMAVHNEEIWEKKALQEIAQEKYELKHSRQEFIERYGKSYL